MVGNMDRIYKGTTGIIYRAVDTPLASGGEGAVYEIQGDKNQVLKVFKPERRTKEREEKLLKMLKYKLDSGQLQQVTWPQDVVYDGSDFIGYVMPRLWDNQNLNKVYATGSNNLNLRHRMFIAYNLCVAVDTIHSLNQVCGDLNPQNICVNLNLSSPSALRVTLVDTDSYHVTDGEKTYRCEVGLGNYLAPEIQNKLTNGLDLKTAPLPTFTKETDLFALAVHVFSLIMNGCHPFACAKKTNQGYEHNMEQMNDVTCDSVVLPQPIDNIKDGFFPFHQKKEGITYPLYAPEFESLPVELQTLFIRTFEDGYRNPKARPTTEEWLYVLGKYQAPQEYQRCGNGHHYLKQNTVVCPYCEIEKRMHMAMGSMIPESMDVPTALSSQEIKDSSSYEYDSSSQTGTGTKKKGIFQVGIEIVGFAVVIIIILLPLIFCLMDSENQTWKDAATVTTEAYTETQLDGEMDEESDDEEDMESSEEDADSNFIQNFLLSSKFYNPSLFDVSYTEYTFLENGRGIIRYYMYDEDGNTEVTGTYDMKYTVNEEEKTVSVNSTIFYYIEKYKCFRASKEYNLEQGDRMDWEYYEETRPSCMIPMEDNPDVEEMIDLFETANGY